MRNKNLRLILASFVFLFLSSCSTNSSNQKILSQIDSGIIQANNTLIHSNNDILESLKLSAENTKTKYKAEQWLPIALQSDSAANQLLRYIDGIKASIKDNLKSGTVEDFFAEQERGSLLFKKLFAFKTKVTGIDSASDKVDWPGFINANDSMQSFKSFQQQFRSISVAEAQTFLSSLQSNILQCERQHLLRCLHATTTWTHDFEVFEAIVGQNAQILKAGDALEITAGLGSFSQTKLPEITIAGKEIQLNENGLAVYKMKTSKRLGNYSIPVTIQFIDQGGKPVEREFSVEYTIAEAIRKEQE